MLICFLFYVGKLTLKHYPTGTDLEVILHFGRSIITCEVESDRPFKLQWYRNGKLLALKKPPPFHYPYADGSGASLVQWPYINGMSKGTYECRATNGFDSPVSYKVKFTPAPS